MIGKDYILIRGDSTRVPLEDGSVHAIAFSPPYFNLREYGTASWVGGDPSCDHQPPDRGGNSGNKGQYQKDPRRYSGPNCHKCGARRIDRQIGLEPTPDEFVAAMVAVGREAWRVLRDDGTLWVNIADTFCSTAPGTMGDPLHRRGVLASVRDDTADARRRFRPETPEGLKPKDLMMIPARVAMGLQADGWYLRDAVVWAKVEVDEDGDPEGSCMPGSQRDRCTFAYEMVYQFSKRPRYFFDVHGARTSTDSTLRNVWRVNTQPTRDAHFATWPEELVRRILLLSTSEKGCCPACKSPWNRIVESDRQPTRPGVGSKVYVEPPIDADSPYRKHNGDICGNRDPQRHVTKFRTLGWEPSCRCDAGDPEPCLVADFFCGTGTTGQVARELGRRFVGIDLNMDYLRDFARQRVASGERPHAAAPRRGRKQARDLGLLDLLDSVEAAR